MRFEVTDVIPSEHPALAGHFPGDPVVPAVVILDRVRKAFGKWRNTAPITNIYKAKFTAVLRPEEDFLIILVNKIADRFSFHCQKADGQKFAFGEFRVGSSRVEC